MTSTYTEILSRNIRAARNRKDLGQESLAVRMRALGHDAWIRQTVGSAERGRRRVTAEEVLGLALALETSIAALLKPSDDDGDVDLPSGKTVYGRTVVELVDGRHIRRTVTWEGDEPVFVPLEYWVGDIEPGRAVDAVLDKSRNAG